MLDRAESSGGEILAGVDTVLVTGASGFVGRRLSDRLEALGKRVVRTSRGAGVDLTKDQLPLEGVGHVFHAGARTGVSAAWEDPAGFIETNTLATVRVLDQCRRHGCGVTFLSAYIYGNPQRIPIKETDSIDANNPYALSKYLAEQACGFFAKNYNVKVVSLRLFNAYGPGQGLNFLVPFIVEQVINPAYDKIEVMDLHPSRDYIYIDDAVEAILWSTRATNGSVFNVGSGCAYSVEDVIKLVCKAAGVSKPYFGKAQRRQNEIDLTKADVSAIYDAVGWKPQTTLAAGLQEMVKGRTGA